MLIKIKAIVWGSERCYIPLERIPFGFWQAVKSRGRLSYINHKLSWFEAEVQPSGGLVYFWSNLALYYTSMVPTKAWVFVSSSSLLGPEPKFLSMRAVRLTDHLSSSTFLCHFLLTFSSLSHHLESSQWEADTSLRGSVTVNIKWTFLGFPLLQDGCLGCPGSLVGLQCLQTDF